MWLAVRAEPFRYTACWLDCSCMIHIEIDASFQSERAEGGQPSSLRVARVVAVAVAAGILGEVVVHATLFESAPTGVGRTIFLLIPIVVLLCGRWLVGVSPSGSAIGLLLGAAFFAVMLTVRGSPVLAACNLTGAIALVVLAAFGYRHGRLMDLTITDHARATLGGLLAIIGHPVLLLRDDVSDWRERLGRSISRSRSVLRGVALALALLLVFGALLVSADAVFANLLDNIFGFDIDAGVLVGATLVAAATAWALVGLVRYSVARGPLVEPERKVGLLGKTETIIMLTPLAGLFLVFVVIQFTYLFGGVDTILATGGLTRAEYYRQGFFQLVVVAALVIALILVVDWAHRPKSARIETPVAILFGSLVVLTGVMVASALARLTLYVDSFGLTELRVYTTAFVIWLAICLLLLLGTVVRGSRRPFAVGALIAGIVVGAGLNLVNPDALIARVNIQQHIDTGTELDTGYLAHHLSTDAIPTIAGLLNDISDPCVRHQATLAAIRDLDTSGGWRSYHWGRSQARNSIGALEPGAPPDCDT